MDRNGSDAARWLAEFHSHPNSQHEGTNMQALRRTLHQEEHDELMYELEMAARGTPDLAQIAREIADVLYVTYGTAWAFGIDADAALAEIHRAAMDKMNAGLRRADGKILKPPGFVPPDMTAAIAAALPGARCPTCSGRGWHTAGGNDPAACGRCPAGEAWAAASSEEWSSGEESS